MKSRRHTIVASALLAAIFAIPSIYLARENAELAGELEQGRSRASGNLSERQTSDRGRFNQREMTVGRLLQQGPDVRNAGSLLRSFFSAQETGHLFDIYALSYQLNQLSLEELRTLRADLRKLPKLDRYTFESLENLISQAEIAVSDQDPGTYFDEAIKSARFDRSLSAKLREWASSDPKAAVAWFEGKTDPNDFKNGSISDRKNRALAFAALLEGLAPQNLDLAVNLFSKETRQAERAEAGKVLIPLTVYDAVANDDTRLLGKFLETAVDQINPFNSAVPNPWQDYTKATGDPMKSVELLKSLQNQADFGKKMATIIAAKTDMPFTERMDWINEQIPETEERINALESSFRGQMAQDSFTDDLNKRITQAPGQKRDLELLAAARVLESTTHPKEAERVANEISDPQIRARADEFLGTNPFSNDPFK